MSEVVFALYDNVERAHRAINELVNNGFDSGDIGLVVSDPDKRHLEAKAQTEIVYTDENVTGSEGAGFGAAVGSFTGLVAGLVAITIPGVGPIIAAGPLAAVLGGATGAAIGAVTGAVTGGVAASLINLGVPEEEAEYYMEAVRRGHALVTVNTSDATVERAIEILHRHNSIDIDHRVKQWREDGWFGFDPHAAPFTSEELRREREAYNARHTDEPYEPMTRNYPYKKN